MENDPKASENGDSSAFPHDDTGFTGLTKREYIATAIMGTLMTGLSVPMSARTAVQAADALLEELAK